MDSLAIIWIHTFNLIQAKKSWRKELFPSDNACPGILPQSSYIHALSLPWAIIKYCRQHAIYNIYAILHISAGYPILKINNVC